MRVLLDLLYQARNTQFGRDHDFHRIRTLVDFQRLVPLRTLADFQRLYWEPAGTQLAGVTWPGRVQQPAAAGQTDRDSSIQLPDTSSLAVVQRTVLKTGLALAAVSGVHTRLFSGRFLFTGEESTRRLLALPPFPGDRPILLHPHTLAEVPTRRTASDSASAQTEWLDGLRAEPITALGGSLPGLLHLLRKIKDGKAAQPLARTWPELAVVFCLRESTEGSLDLLREELGKNVLLLEMLYRPEGAVALTDPRHGRLRLLIDHGLHFDFIPESRRNQLHPERLGIGEVAAGGRYELAVSSPMGLWACRTGLLATVENLYPPLLGLVERVEPPVLAAPPIIKTHPPVQQAAPLPAPHPRSAGSPVKLPETFSHSPWSAHADRG
jgi:GH3 auxin-responsive promoter